MSAGHSPRSGFECSRNPSERRQQPFLNRQNCVAPNSPFRWGITSNATVSTRYDGGSALSKYFNGRSPAVHAPGDRLARGGGQPWERPHDDTLPPNWADPSIDDTRVRRATVLDGLSRKPFGSRVGFASKEQLGRDQCSPRLVAVCIHCPADCDVGHAAFVVRCRWRGADDDGCRGEILRAVCVAVSRIRRHPCRPRLS